MIKLNNKLIKRKEYPNGELLIDPADYRPLRDPLNLTWSYRSDSDIAEFFLVTKYLQQEYPNPRILLTIEYLPYSRMDRTESNSALTLKYIAELINSLNFYNVKIIEPHSDVSLALINNSEPVYIVPRILNKLQNVISFNELDAVYFPDAGAYKRYNKFLYPRNSLFGLKTRDFSTGKLGELTITGNIPNHDSRVIIVDDLCSRGGTFVQAAKKLIEMGADAIYLAVAHVEETIYKGEVFDWFLRVYASNSLQNVSKNRKLKLFDIAEL